MEQRRCGHKQIHDILNTYILWLDRTGQIPHSNLCYPFGRQNSNHLTHQKSRQCRSPCWGFDPDKRTCLRPPVFCGFPFPLPSVHQPSSRLCNGSGSNTKYLTLPVETLYCTIVPLVCTYLQTLCRGRARILKNRILASWLDIVISSSESFRSKISLTLPVSKIDNGEQISITVNITYTWLLQSRYEDFVFGHWTFLPAICFYYRETLWPVEQEHRKCESNKTN